MTGTSSNEVSLPHPCHGKKPKPHAERGPTHGRISHNTQDVSARHWHFPHAALVAMEARPCLMDVGACPSAKRRSRTKRRVRPTPTRTDHPLSRGAWDRVSAFAGRTNLWLTVQSNAQTRCRARRPLLSQSCQPTLQKFWFDKMRGGCGDGCRSLSF